MSFSLLENYLRPFGGGNFEPLGGTNFTGGFPILGGATFPPPTGGLPFPPPLGFGIPGILFSLR